LVVEAKDQKVVSSIGPFSNFIRPFTINGIDTLGFVNVDGLLGFEVGDVRTGRKLYGLEVEGFRQGPVKRHACPSHGILFLTKACRTGREFHAEPRFMALLHSAPMV
jgi:hypothetical protein